jgi:hypothetical protein
MVGAEMLDAAEQDEECLTFRATAPLLLLAPGHERPSEYVARTIIVSQLRPRQ